MENSNKKQMTSWINKDEYDYMSKYMKFRQGVGEQMRFFGLSHEEAKQSVANIMHNNGDITFSELIQFTTPQTFDKKQNWKFVVVKRTMMHQDEKGNLYKLTDHATSEDTPSDHINNYPDTEIRAATSFDF